jgi:hypothetical protein
MQIDPNPGFMKQLSLLERQMWEEKKEKEALLSSKLEPEQIKELRENKNLSPEPRRVVSPLTSPTRNASLIKREQGKYIHIQKTSSLKP